MDNSKMIAGRFQIAYNRKKLYNLIVENLKAGRTVYLCTAYRATKYTAKHIDFFKLAKNGVFVRSGNNWNCIDYTVVKIA